jgi:hypothetical protein
LKTIPNKSGESRCITYVMATSEDADYIKALFNELDTAA